MFIRRPPDGEQVEDPQKPELGGDQAKEAAEWDPIYLSEPKKQANSKVVQFEEFRVNSRRFSEDNPEVLFQVYEYVVSDVRMHVLGEQVVNLRDYFERWPEEDAGGSAKPRSRRRHEQEHTDSDSERLEEDRRSPEFTRHQSENNTARLPREAHRLKDINLNLGKAAREKSSPQDMDSPQEKHPGRESHHHAREPELFRIVQNKSFQGTLSLNSIRKQLHRYNFLNYIHGGCRLKIIYAIDFSTLQQTINTRSNLGQARGKQQDLHFLDDKQNPFIQSIKKCESIIRYLDTTNKSPVYGFGAKLPDTYTVHSNCFAISGKYFEPQLEGALQIIDSKCPSSSPPFPTIPVAKPSSPASPPSEKPTRSAATRSRAAARRSSRRFSRL